MTEIDESKVSERIVDDAYPVYAERSDAEALAP